MISDLVVIADAVDKLLEFEDFRRSSAFGFRHWRDLTAIKPAAPNGFDKLFGSSGKISEIILRFAGQRDANRVVKIVRPESVDFESVRIGESGEVSIIFGDDDSAVFVSGFCDFF